MIGGILLLGLSGSILSGEPAAFENYFDDPVKGVDISQDSAIKACLQNGETIADKVSAAYNKCFGDDYDFDDLAGAAGSADADSDGLPDSFEGNEACFYQEMSWVDGSGVADADAIKADLAGLDDGLKGDFNGNIDACAAWSGSFGSRNKREAVPDVMGSGRAALNWLRSAVRKTRSANPEKGEEKESVNGKNPGKKAAKKNGKKGRKAGKKGKKAGKKNGGKDRNGNGKNPGKKAAKKTGKKGIKSGKKGAKKTGKKGRKSGKKGAKKTGKKSSRKAGKKGAKKNGKKSRKSGKKGKKAAKKNGKKGDKKEKTSDKEEKISNQKEKKSGNSAKKNSSGKESGRNEPKVLDEQTYNKLWCFDLAMEQVLEKCVEEKIKN